MRHTTRSPLEKKIQADIEAANRARKMGLANRRHGESAHADNTPEYRAWRGALDRCTNERAPQYRNYGGRGIAVCTRWRTSYESFLLDMGRRPSPKHSLDRINVDGPYSPSNCRWATAIEQQRNRRSNRIVQYQGESMPLVVAAERAGTPYRLVKGRLKQGWTLERALSAPLRTPRTVLVNGNEVMLADASRAAGLSPDVVADRVIRLGWSVEKALATPTHPGISNGKRRAHAAKVAS